MILFGLPNYEYLLAELEPISFSQKGRFRIDRYKNGELFVELFTPVVGADCVLVGSIAPPDERLCSLLLLANTLKKEGAYKVTAFLPYLAYSRQDKDQPGKSLAAAWVASVLEASGIDEVVTIDVHSERDKQLFNIPLVSMFPAELFASAIVKHGLVDATIVAPDNGAIWRCQAVRRALGMSAEHIPYFEKQRDEKGIRHAGPFGEVGTRVLIIDDMLDTGGTLISACEKLAEAGAQEIYIMVTHGLFTGTEWKKLWSSNVERIFCTDTIPLSERIAGDIRITTISIAPLLEDTPILFKPDLQWL